MRQLNRELVQLAHTYNPEKHRPAGMMLSEKLDGMRALWDGGITRGLESAAVPWANTLKDHINLEVKYSTGLWSRYGKPIQAPSWFLDQLPSFCCDGELYAGRGNFQKLVSTTKKLVPIDSEWENVKYMIFDVPPPAKLFGDGKINNPNFQKQMKDCYSWALGKGIVIPNCLDHDTSYRYLRHNVKETEHVKVHDQMVLPYSTDEARKFVEEEVERVTDLGGEGLILKNRGAIWEPRRNDNILKVKKLEDSEGIVTGYISGKETDKGSKLRGLMGAIILDFRGKRLELSGFTDAERSFGNAFNHSWAWDNPGMQLPNELVDHPLFPRGSIVTFRYRELTEDGLPKEARFWRKA